MAGPADYNILNSSINEAGTYARVALLPPSHNEPPVNPGGVPLLTSLAPSSAPLGGVDVTVTVTGVLFGPWTVVVFTGIAQTTTFVNNTTVTFVVKPTTPGYVKARPYAVQAKNGSFFSGVRNFTFT
jgi:hypothetical protein